MLLRQELSAAESTIDANAKMHQPKDSVTELEEELKVQDMVTSWLKSQLDAQGKLMDLSKTPAAQLR